MISQWNRWKAWRRQHSGVMLGGSLLTYALMIPLGWFAPRWIVGIIFTLLVIAIACTEIAEYLDATIERIRDPGA